MSLEHPKIVAGWRNVARLRGLAGLVGCVALLGLLLSCGDDPTSPEDQPPEPVVTLQDSTVVLTEDVEEDLVAVSEDGEITVTGSFAEQTGISIGSVLVSGSNSLAREGFLRTVTGIEEDGENLRLTTEQASLTEAIESGEIRAEMYLDREDVDSVLVVEGVEYTPDKTELSKEFSFSLDLVVYDRDRDRLTRNDQARVTGDVVLTSGLELEIDIEPAWSGPKLTHMLLAANRSTELNLQAHFGADVDLLEPYKHKIATIKGGVYTIPAGPIPIVVVVDLEVFIKVGLTGSVSVEIGYSMTETSRSGSVYRNGAWEDFDEYEKTVSPLDLEVVGELEAKAGLMARISMKLYGVAGPYIMAELFAQGTAGIEWTPEGTTLSAEVACGNSVSLGFLLEVFSKELVNISAEWELWRLVIWEGSWPVGSVDLLSPNGGEVWPAGSQQEISWDGQYSELVISYSTDSGAAWTEITRGLTLNDPKTYVWTLPNGCIF